MTPTGKHPNTAAAVITTLAAGWLVAFAAHFGLHMGTVTALSIIGAAAPVRLYVGRRGILGAGREAWKTLLYGSGSG